MSSKQTILNAIKQNNQVQEVPLPNISEFGITFDDKFEQFKINLKNVGADAIMCKSHEVNEVIKTLYSDVLITASNTSLYQQSTFELNESKEPNDLKDIELAVIKGEFGVAENGAVWINNNENKHRALYFIAQNLVIIIHKKDLVHNMHEAFERIDYEEIAFGLFISGPSKTADIEQSLVIGAHGPKSGYVLIVE